MAVYSQLPMYYMDDNGDKIGVDLIILPTTDHPQISIILDDTCDDCSLKTNLIVTNIRQNVRVLNLTRWVEYYDNSPSEVLNHFISFWNITDNNVTISDQEEEILLSGFFHVQPSFI